MTTPIPTTLIEETLRRGFHVLRQAGLEPEPLEVGLAVERHRWAWRPSEVRVVLIAESHVFTSARDLALRVQPAALPEPARTAPTEFVRLVYCLGYGETRVLSGVPQDGANRGTPQFWNIFGRIAATGRLPTTTSASGPQRLAWKVRTLQRLQADGVWLLDSSMHGIYAPGAVRVNPAVTESLHAIWLEGYGGWLLRHFPDAYRCVIGKGVASTLQRLGLELHNWIYQPQARAVEGVDLNHGWDTLSAPVSGVRTS